VENIGKHGILHQMKSYLVLIFTCVYVSTSYGQKFHFATSLGTSQLNWSQSQTSLNAGAYLQFQKPGKPTQLFGQLTIIGNLQSSTIDNHHVAFRGGKGEIGLNRFTKSGIFASTSIYSVSMAKKTSSTKGYFTSEEKFTMHGLRAGLGFRSNGKIKTTIQAKVFEPILRSESMHQWGKDQSQKLSNQLGYQASLEFRLPKWALGFDYEQIKYGAPFAPLQSTSAQITYFF
jgi:hypothetical protein